MDDQGSELEGDSKQYLSRRTDVDAAGDIVRALLEEHLEQMIAKVAPQVAAKTDVAEIRALLMAEAVRMLSDTAREIDVRAAQALIKAKNAPDDPILGSQETAAIVFRGSAQGLRGGEAGREEEN